MDALNSHQMTSRNIFRRAPVNQCLKYVVSYVFLNIAVTTSDEAYPPTVSVTRYIPSIEKNFVRVVIYGESIKFMEKTKKRDVAMMVWKVQNSMTSVLNGIDWSSIAGGDAFVTFFTFLPIVLALPSSRYYCVRT